MFAKGITARLKTAAEALAGQSVRLTRIAGLKGSIVKVDTDIAYQERELGNLVYTQHIRNRPDSLTVRARCEEIRQLYRAREQMEQEMAAVKLRSELCSHCRKALPAAAKYCPHCGKIRIIHSGPGES